MNLLLWKLVPERWGGGKDYIQNFKDAWVQHNRKRIRMAASLNKIPPELLAGVCWIEVAGDPDFIDRVAFEVRSFDWSGPPFIDRYFTVTNHPAKTSFGSVSIQLRTAAQTLHMDTNKMTKNQFRELALCLERDAFNIDIVAQHLRQLINHDRLPSPLSMDDIRIVGTRYNRGIGLSLEQIKQNMSYGNFIVKFWPRFSRLIC
jgi:hypothetical protein